MAVTQTDLDNAVTYIETDLYIPPTSAEFLQAINIYDFETRTSLIKIYSLSRNARHKSGAATLAVTAGVKTAATEIINGTADPTSSTWPGGQALVRVAEVRSAP